MLPGQIMLILKLNLKNFVIKVISNEIIEYYK